MDAVTYSWKFKGPDDVDSADVPADDYDSSATTLTFNGHRNKAGEYECTTVSTQSGPAKVSALLEIEILCKYDMFAFSLVGNHFVTQPFREVNYSNGSIFLWH